jgi:hypothetical protein
MVKLMGEKTNKDSSSPKISSESMKEMAAFFARTSIPRIIEEMKNGQRETRKS